MLRKFSCNAPHLDLFGSRLTDVNEVHPIIVIILEDIVFLIPTGICYTVSRGSTIQPSNSKGVVGNLFQLFLIHILQKYLCKL